MENLCGGPGPIKKTKKKVCPDWKGLRKEWKQGLWVYCRKGLGSYFVLVAKLYHQSSDQIKSLKIHLEGARDFCLCEIPTQVHASHLSAYL